MWVFHILFHESLFYGVGTMGFFVECKDEGLQKG